MRNAEKNFLSKISSLIIFSIILFISAASLMAKEITIVADEWSPHCGKANSTQPGYGVEIAQRVFEEAGYTVLYTNVPWPRAIEDTRQGKYNAIIGAYKEEAPDFIFPDEEFGITQNSFFAKRGASWTFTGLSSLRAVRIGVVSKYSYGEELDTYFKDNPQSVEPVFSETPVLLNIKMLLADRFDVFIENEDVLLYKANEIGMLGEIVNVGNTGVSGRLYIAFSPNISKSKEYAAIFSRGIRKLKYSGALEKILDKYGIAYWR